MLTIERLHAKLAEADLQALASLLIDAVAGNASIGYPAGLSRPEAREFRQEVASGIGAKRLIVLVARIEGQIRGTVQLPEFAFRPDGRLRPSSFFYKVLTPS